MKKILFFLSIGLTILTGYSFADEVSVNPENIKVLLLKETDGALLESKGGYYVVDSINHNRLSSGFFGKRFVIRTTEDGLKWGEEFPKTCQVTIMPKNPNTTFLINGIEYQGILHVYKKASKLMVVNEIDVESYVKAILSNEFSLPVEKEALAAVAIAVRTNAYANITKRSDMAWHVNADAPIYQGSALIFKSSSVCEAVDQTCNLIMINSQGVPFETAMTEHCAGKTASYDIIFRKESAAPKAIVNAPHAALSKQEVKWSYSISKQELGKLFNFRSIKSVESFLDNKSGKTYALRLKGNDDVRDIDFITAQKVMGENNLKSNDFKVEAKGETILFSGFGKGLGVGLCLYSSAKMAQNGESAEKILAKFYPDTTLVNLTR
jgi:SpoIID/LytB domain protein